MATPRRSFLLAPALAALLASPLALAHRPTSGGIDQVIDAPKISHAVYGMFEDGQEVFTIRMEFDEGFALPFELLIPHKQEQRDHRPWYAVIAPGLPAPLASELDLLPVDVPEGHGLFIDRHDEEQREVIFESFSRRMMWTVGATALAVQPGETTIVVWSPERTTGEFVIGFGVEEDFSGDAIQTIFSGWGDYAY